MTLYALVIGQEVFAHEYPSDEYLGSLRVEVHADDASVCKKELIKVALEHERHRKGILFYRQHAALGGDGSVTVKLFDQDKQVVAHAKIEKAGAAIHPWSPFGWPDEQKEAQEERLFGGVREEDVTAPDSGWARPKFDGTKPLVYSEEIDGALVRHFYEDDGLPALMQDRTAVPANINLPEAERTRLDALIVRLGDEDVGERDAAELALWHSMDTARAVLAKRVIDKDPEIRARILELLRPFEPKLAIRFTGDAILVESKLGMDIEHARKNFLVRWWVNGKPVVSDHAGPGVERSTNEMLSSQAPDTAFKLKLKLNLEKLGAKSGDNIGAQILFCPYGWEYDMEMVKMLEKMERSQILEESELLKTPTASNIAEWKVP